MTDTTQQAVKIEAKGQKAPSKLEAWHPFDSLRREMNHLLDEFDRDFLAYAIPASALHR